MNSSLLALEIQTFINQNIGASISILALQKNPFPEHNWIEILNQIASKTKARQKLPIWFNAENIIFPSKISIEQTSSEKTAIYKSTLMSGENLIDLTGGFGVDAYFFSLHFNSVYHCEINPALSSIVQHNFKILKIKNIKCESGDSELILKKLNTKFDWIYIDPSRRNEVKGKVFMLKDCLPDVPKSLDFYFNYTKNILVKTAPILDISAGLLELKNVKTIHVIAVDNEVKELLWEIEKDFSESIFIKTINLTKEKNEIFNFTFKKIYQANNYILPQKFLYEPNAAIMKSGGFEALSIDLKMGKLHQHSHLYTSNELKKFPGRVFEIQTFFLYSKIEMKYHLENSKANLTVRNFPETVAFIRKKWKIKEGGNRYCFFTINASNDKIVLICSKI